MEIIKKQLIFILALFFLSGCSQNKLFEIVLFSDFDKDRVKLYYGNAVLDSVITTDESIGIAHRITLKQLPQKYLFININNEIIDSVMINKNTCGVLIEYKNMNLQIKTDSVCKKRRFL